MPTTRETILTALADLLRLIPFVPVLRGEVLPERVPTSGLIILRDGDPGDPAVTLSPLLYHFQHRVELGCVSNVVEILWRRSPRFNLHRGFNSPVQLYPRYDA